MNLNLFVKEYLIAAIWADLPEENMNQGLTIDNIAQESKDQATYDCARFIEQNIDDLNIAVNQTSLDQVAHDFWFTRNGHGAGFWDGDYGDAIGKRLTKSSKSFGEKYLYIGDDGLIYIA